MRRVVTPVCLSSSVITGPSVWPSNGLPCSALLCSTNWPPLGFGRGGGDRYLAPELIRRSGFAFANALHLGSMQRIDLRPALAMILEAHLHRQGEEIGKARLQCLVPGDLAANIADHPAQPGAQELQLTPRPLELVRMAVPTDHDHRALRDPAIALP